MKIGQFAVNRPVAVTMRIAALVLLGYICMLRLPVDLLPKVDIPTVVVNVSWRNTGPEEMEAQIARPLEQALGTVRGLDMISTSTSQGSTSVRVQFQYGVDVDKASVEVMQLVARATGQFPNDPNISEPQIFRFDPSSLPVLIYGVSSIDGDVTKLQTKLKNEITPRLEAAGGVASVTVSGGMDRSILVNVDPEKLRARQITFSKISQRLQQENISVPAGVAREGKTQYNVRAIGYAKSVDDIAKLPLANVDGAQITIGDVAEVSDSHQEQLTFVRSNGQPAVSISVTKQKDANTIEVAQSVKEVLESVKKQYPDLTFRNAYDQAKFVSSSVDDLKETALIGAALAILIITFFLRNLKSTFVVALSIPISIISTFSLFYFGGFTLNTISLSGLALASGLIVDDAIVVLENIYRHIEQRRCKAAEAAVTGTQEILGAVFASTFTVMIVFLPLLLIKGQAGQVFTQFALVVVFSMAVSILDALTIVPMLASRMVNERDVIEEAHPEERLKRDFRPNLLTRFYDWAGTRLYALDSTYRRGLDWALSRRSLMVGMGLVTVVLSVLLWSQVGQESLPETDSGNLNVNVRLPIGTPVTQTDSVMHRIEATLLADPDVETVLSAAGGNVGLRGVGGGGSPQNGSATVKLKADRKSKTRDVVKRLQGQTRGIAGAQVQISAVDTVSRILGNNQGFSIDVYGQDLQTLTTAARQVQQAMLPIAGLQNPDLNTQDALPEIQWQVDRQKAQALGVSFSDAAAVIAAATNGQLSTYYQEAGFQYPIYVQLPKPTQISSADVGALPVAYTDGIAITLSQVATPTHGMGPNQITRQNRQRVITVGGNVVDRALSDVQNDVFAALEKVTLPSGVFYDLGYQQRQAAKQYGGLGISVILAIALIYMLLAAQFESFIDPLVILVSVPLCAIGLVLGLFLTDRSFGLTAFIGLLMLVGIAVKNGILLIDYTHQLRQRGLSRHDALLTAGPTRLRPILMTSLAAIFGMLPLALGMGEGSEMYVPLATVVIGGLMTSTVLTLFIVPVVYTFFDDLRERFYCKRVADSVVDEQSEHDHATAGSSSRS